MESVTIAPKEPTKKISYEEEKLRELRASWNKLRETKRYNNEDLMLLFVKYNGWKLDGPLPRSRKQLRASLSGVAVLAMREAEANIAFAHAIQVWMNVDRGTTRTSLNPHNGEQW